MTALQRTTPTADDHRTAAEAAKIAALPADILQAMEYRFSWVTKDSRPDQLPPDDADLTWFTWLQLGGRGSGKTRTGTEWVWDMAFKHPGCRIAVVAPTQSDARKTCFEGESGLLAKIPPALVSNYNRQEMILTLTNNSQIFGYSAEEPDRLRGPQHNFAWCDELAAWRYLDSTLDNLLMGLRLGAAPRLIATTTPRPIKRLKEIIADSSTRVDRVSTYANRAHLPPHFLNIILKRYEGTRLGRQELMAELIDDVPGALWTRANLETTRRLPDRETGALGLPDMEELVVAVDPSVTSTADSDETGIVVCGRGTDKRGYVLDDKSLVATPAQWAEQAVLLYDQHKAGKIVYEANQGGDMVAETLRNAAVALKNAGKRDTDFVNVTPVWASRGKVTRAEPISALYEQGRVSHVGVLPKLEDQMCEFTSDFDRKEAGYSPDRVDALVWGLSQVMLAGTATTGILEYYRQENERRVHEKMTGRPWTAGADSRPKTYLMIPPSKSTNMAFGATGKRYVLRPDGLMDVDEQDRVGLLGAGFRLMETENVR